MLIVGVMVGLLMLGCFDVTLLTTFVMALPALVFESPLISLDDNKSGRARYY